MKRIQLFEFEDFAWFPNWLRMPMTRYIAAVHRLLGSRDQLATLLAKALPKAREKQILDMCSGGGGPMPEVLQSLHEDHDMKEVSLTMTDLYPNVKAAARINAQGNPKLRYLTTPVDATNPQIEQDGVRTMVCSMHHMPPKLAHDILASAKADRQPIVIFEISDNSSPKWLWWTAIPISFLMVFFITPMVRPMTWQQLVFTYLIPLLPLFIAWDGAVSNVRTYTMEDLDILLKDLHSDDYTWEKGVLKGRGKKAYLMGLPA